LIEDVHVLWVHYKLLQIVNWKCIAMGEIEQMTLQKNHQYQQVQLILTG